MARTAGSRAAAPHDGAVWAEAMRDVIPLRGRGAALSPMTPCAPEPALGPADNDLAADRPDPAPFESVAGIDRANAERLKRGLHRIEARLDLHGLTQSEAHRELADFVEVSHRAGRRCLLVITGRGLGPDGPGVLKSAVPRWLAEAGLRRRLLAIAAAQPRHGGAGALYLLLRRQR
ncbi:MAG: Smr/MutS family protein [Stellaceae bacterium]